MQIALYGLTTARTKNDLARKTGVVGGINAMTEIGVEPKQLYEGCVQAAIAHAVAVGIYPELNYEHSWDGINYCMNNSQGCRAAITFHNDYIVAVFQDIHKADRNIDALNFFDGAPEEIIQIAKNEALQYVLEDIEGITKPVISSAFWGTWKQLKSVQSLDEIIENGGYIIRSQLLPYHVAMDEWRDYYNLDIHQITLIEKLFNQRINSHKEEWLTLEDDEIQLLYGDFEECLVSLEELKFFIKQDTSHLSKS